MTGRCFPIMYAMLLTTVWFSCTTTAFFAGYNIFRNPAAEITPADAYVAVGKELVLNCTLTPHYKKSLDATSMYFGRMSGVTMRISARFQHIIDPRILQLRIPRMEKENGGTYACYMNETSVGGDEAELLAVPANVQVDFLPDPITSVTCISDNFESMVCYWCPAVMPSKLTKWILDWRIGSASAWNSYPIPYDAKGQARCRCSWLSTGQGTGWDTEHPISADAFKPSSVYQLKVTTVSRFLADQSTTEFVIAATQSIVRPREVQDFQAESTSSTSLVVSWRHPIHLHPSWFPLVYELSYKAGWTDEDTVVLQVGKGTSVQLTELWPATNYNLSVRCRPLSGQFWSNSSSVRIMTPDDVPSASPNIPTGSFRTHPCRPERENCRTITVFWQPIAVKHHSGVLHGYEVSCQGLQDENVHELNVDLSSLSASFTDLDTDQHYVISVVGYNNVGRSPAAILNLPPSNRMTRHPENLVAELSRGNHAVTFSWSQPTVAVSNYTLLWCEGVASQTDTCQGQLHGVTIPGHVTSVERTWEVMYVYALSSNSQSGSSGMKRGWVCVYEYNGLPGTPVFSFGTDRAARSLTIQWRPLECSLETRGQVLYYSLLVEETGRSDPTETSTLPPGDSMYLVRHLHPATNYTVTLTAVTRAGPGHPALRHVTTLESKPDDPPHGLHVSQLSTTETNLTWAASPTPNGVITKYEVIVRDRMEIVQQVLTDDTVQFMLLRNLDGYKNYSVTVVAVNMVGVSDESRPVSFQTPIRAAAQINVDEMRVEPYKATEAMVKWSRPSPPNGPITSYVTEYVIRDEDNNFQQQMEDSVPANQTETRLVMTTCSDHSVLVDVRVQAVTIVRGQRLLADFSEWRRAIMCKDPGSSWYVWAIPVAYVFVIAIILISFGLCSLRRTYFKKLEIRTPDRPEATQTPTTAEWAGMGVGTFREIPDGYGANNTDRINISSTSPTSHDVIPSTNSTSQGSTSGISHVGMPDTSSGSHVGTFGTSQDGMPGIDDYNRISIAPNISASRIGASRTSQDGMAGIDDYNHVGMVPPVPFLNSQENASSGSANSSSGGAEMISGYSAMVYNQGSPDSNTRLLATPSEGSTLTGSPSSDAFELLNSEETEESSLSDDVDGVYTKVEKQQVCCHMEPPGQAADAVIDADEMV